MKVVILSMMIVLIMAVTAGAEDICIGTDNQSDYKRVKVAMLYAFPNSECGQQDERGNCQAMKYTDDEWLGQLFIRVGAARVTSAETMKARTEGTVIPTGQDRLLKLR